MDFWNFIGILIASGAVTALMNYLLYRRQNNSVIDGQDLSNQTIRYKFINDMFIDVVKLKRKVAELESEKIQSNQKFQRVDAERKKCWELLKHLQEEFKQFKLSRA